MSQFFKVVYRSKKSQARLGRVFTDHGVINTPAFVAVATKGTIKALSPSFIAEVGLQAVFVNTYHLLTHPGVKAIETAGGIHRFANLNLPLMSDSGGFQVFSLSKKRLFSRNKDQEEIAPAIVKIDESGVKFRSVFDGSLIDLSPENSIEAQVKIGADIMMAFDECLDFQADYLQTKAATERTHRWLSRCLETFEYFKNNNKSLANRNQFLYGIIQGGFFKDLRQLSAKFVVNQQVDGVAIGGVSVGEPKEKMTEVINWLSPFLPTDRPVHLLGIGRVEDILTFAKYGIDTFDCVEPTRLARMGTIYQWRQPDSKKLASEITVEKIDISKGKYREDLSRVDEECLCFVCKNFTKSYLHHLFKTRELLAYTLATYHNLSVMIRVFDAIKEMIAHGVI
ncbi:MAG: tRNA guanosine(34) transglycosylase Tgt [Patescibacteria group bacterium]|nr:tRNA guanosine(34) transglycosylase Tgt [Patescibacteria group bacterium]